MTNTIPKAFFAYPSSGQTLKGAIQDATPELNKRGHVNIQTWEDYSPSGKFVIHTICEAIDDADLFFADLTGLNANVMFELGYAIARDKRVWLILDETYTEEKKMFDQLKVLTTLGHLSCCNSQDIVSGFYDEKPFLDIENTIFQRAIKPNLKPGGDHKIFYLKSQHENQTSMRVSNLLQERLPNKIILDDPRETPIQSLTWYATHAFSCKGLICHFTNPKREGAYLQTVRHALVCGVAYGAGVPLLMLAEGDFLSPIDYSEYLKHYNTAPDALTYLEDWLTPVEQNLKTEQGTTTTRPSPMRSAEVIQPNPPELYSAEEYNKRGETRYKEGNLDLAIADYDKAIELDPDFHEAYNNLGNAYRDKGDFYRAINEYNMAIALVPEYPYPYNGRGDAYKKLGQFDEAIKDYNTAIRLKPDYVPPYNSLGEIYFKRQEIDSAIKVCAKAIELKPNSPSLYNNRGILYRKKGEFDRAIKDYDKAIKMEHDSKAGELDLALPYHNRGNAYRDKDEYNRAIEDYNEAIKLKPDYALAYCNRGNAYFYKEQYDRAIEDYSKAIDFKEDYGIAYSNRAQAYLHLEQWRSARAHFKTAKGIGVDIIASFHNDYESVEDFEEKTGIQLPEDIAEMLTQQ